MVTVIFQGVKKGHYYSILIINKNVSDRILM